MQQKRFPPMSTGPGSTEEPDETDGAAIEHATDQAKEDGPSEESGAEANLAYEDMLARLTLATAVPQPEPETPAPRNPTPPPGSITGLFPPAATPAPRPSSPSVLPMPPDGDSTPVAPNPLVDADDEPTIPGIRPAFQAQTKLAPAARAVPAAPPASLQRAAKSTHLHLLVGGLLVLGGMILAVLVLKLLMPTPTAQPAAVVAPTPLPPAPPAPSPSARVEPLPSNAPATTILVAPTGPSPTAGSKTPAAASESAPAVKPEPAPRSPRRGGIDSKPARPATPLAAAASKPAAAGSAATPKAPLAAPPSEKELPTARKSGKPGAYVDPFE
jgi:hypothetical protein